MRSCGRLLLVLLLLAACGGGGEGEGMSGSVGSSDTASGSTAAFSAQPPSGAERKVLRYENITFSVPPTWRLTVRSGVAGLGDFAARAGGRSPRASLLVSTSSPGPIDEAMPKRCEDGPAASVDLIETGFAPVGARTAEFRLWVAACADGTIEDRRAWLLPDPKILFLEEYHVPENVEVVTSAQVG